MQTHDRGARNLWILFLAVWSGLTLFYAFLAWRSLSWSPKFFIKNEDSQRSRVNLVSEKKWLIVKNERPKNVGMDISISGSAGLSASISPISLALKRGKSLYLRSGCVLCHGPDGKGGVKNKNYVKDAIPALNVLSERMLIWEKAEAYKVIKRLVANKPLEQTEAFEELDLPNLAAVSAQYINVRDIIEKGQLSGKKVLSGSTPIDMPEWKGKLSQQDINLIIAYLLSLYPWEESEG